MPPPPHPLPKSYFQKKASNTSLKTQNMETQENLVLIAMDVADPLSDFLNWCVPANV